MTCAVSSPARCGAGTGATSPHNSHHDAGTDAAPYHSRRLQILLVESDRAVRDGCASLLRAEGHAVVACETHEEAVNNARHSTPDVIVCDLDARGDAGVDALRATLGDRSADVIVIVTTSHPSVESSVSALRNGAWDYLPKPFVGTHLQLLIGRAAITIQARDERERVRATVLRDSGNSDRMTLLGISPSFRHAVDLARKVARTDASVMLVGESGTGKELIAQFVHRHSRRDAQRLVVINSAAVPEHLLESEMFGHRRGAFTGADRDKVGLIEMAHKGTFFLDELSDMPTTLQAKLLRVVQDGVVRRVGSETTDAHVDVRFISATNRDPWEVIRSRQLREDLYYRLNVFQIVLPPLRDRREDIPVLAEHFLERSWRRHYPRTPIPTLGASAKDRLQAHSWPGNVRELQNVIEHAAVLAAPGSSIRADDIQLHTEVMRPEASVVSLTGGYHAAKDRVIARFERDYVTQLVARAAGNMALAARLADVDRTTLYRLLERHGVQPERRHIAVA